MRYTVWHTQQQQQQPSGRSERFPLECGRSGRLERFPLECIIIDYTKALSTLLKHHRLH